jgi:hypothetical protein
MSQLTTTTDPMHTEKSASQYLGVTPSCLRRWRRLGIGPSWVSCGRLVRYRQSSLEGFIRENTKRNEGAASEGRR